MVHAVDLKKLTATGEDFILTHDGDELILEFGDVNWPFAAMSFPAMNINDSLGMAVEATLESEGPVHLFGYNGVGFWNSGMEKLETGVKKTLSIFQSRRDDNEEVHALFPRMRGKPNGYYELWAEGAAEADPFNLSAIRLEVEREGKPVRIRIHAIHSFGTCETPTEETAKNYLPVVDRYGQYAHAEWLDKVHSDEELRALQIEEDADIAAHTPSGWDKYGGWADGPSLQATGHFRTQKYHGKWWLVDPEGHLYWSHGATGMGLHTQSDVKGREKLFPEDTPENADFRGRNIKIRMGGGEDWEDKASELIMRRMKSWGMNASGAFMDPRWLEKGYKLPYCVFTTSLRRPDGIHGIGALDEEWEAYAENNIKTAAEKYGDDPYCIGFYIDNEIHTDYNYDDWRKYYRTLKNLMVKHAPNKLYLGSRMDYHRFPRMDESFHNAARAAGEFCDVVSFNQYRYSLANLVLPDNIDKPIMIGEFHFGALDRGVLHTGLRPVKDQAQRAEAYKLFLTSALESPYLVGTHWFTYSAQPITGRFDGENYQIGLVDVCDTPYREMVEAMREIGYNMYKIRRGND